MTQEGLSPAGSSRGTQETAQEGTPPMAGSDDFVCVATRSMPTEAHVIRGMLESAGLTPHVADEHITQMHSFLAPAIGVRVMVPTSQADAAREAIAAWEAGAYEIEGDGEAKPTLAVADAPFYSPDRAVMLGFVLTPVFGALIQLLNARQMGDAGRRFGAWVDVIALGLISGYAVLAMHEHNRVPHVVLLACLPLGLVNVLWYVIVGQKQSRLLIKTYGAHYPKRSLLVPAMIGVIAAIAVGLGLNAVG